MRNTEEGITVISGVPDDVADDNLEDAVTSIMEDFDAIVQNGDIEVCHTGLRNLTKKLLAEKPLLDLSTVNTVKKH